MLQDRPATRQQLKATPMGHQHASAWQADALFASVQSCVTGLGIKAIIASFYANKVEYGFRFYAKSAILALGSEKT